MHTFLIAAITQDGFIAEETSQTSTVWTSEEDKQFFRRRTKEAGVMVMGSKTFETIGRPLPKRVNIVMTRDKSQLCNVATLQLGEVGYTSASPKDLLAELEQAGYEELALCGGATIYSLFLEAGLIDTLYLTVEPVKFGSGVPLFASTDRASYNVPDFSQEIPQQLQLGEFEYTLKNQENMNEQGTLLLEYKKEK